MLSVKKMIASAEEALGWPYVSPGSNDSKGIDCSGLFVKIFEDQGEKIYHGSNTIYRKYCDEKGPINDISQLKPGMAVFKWNPNTPEKFHDDLGDFQHIGLVVSVNPLEIIHASSVAGKVIMDTKIGKWKYWGKLKNVDYGEEPAPSPSPDPQPSPEPEPTPTPVVFATVYSDNRKPVKMRAKPSTQCGLYDEVPFGSIVEVVEKGDVWSKINYRSRKGWYMMNRFLLIDEDSIPGLGGTEEDIVDAGASERVSVVIDGLTREEAEKLKVQYPQAYICVG